MNGKHAKKLRRQAENIAKMEDVPMHHPHQVEIGRDQNGDPLWDTHYTTVYAPGCKRDIYKSMKKESSRG